MNLREAPVTVRGNDRRDELRDAEGTHERIRGALHEEPAVRTSDEDEGLRNDGDLEVDNHVKLAIVGIDREGRLEGNTKLVLEEGGLLDDADESDTVTWRLV